MKNNNWNIQRFLIPLFTFIYWEYLWDESHEVKYRRHIVKVRGWRTMLVDDRGHGRMTISPIFKVGKKYF